MDQLEVYRSQQDLKNDPTSEFFQGAYDGALNHLFTDASSIGNPWATTVPNEPIPDGGPVDQAAVAQISELCGELILNGGFLPPTSHTTSTVPPSTGPAPTAPPSTIPQSTTTSAPAGTKSSVASRVPQCSSTTNLEGLYNCGVDNTAAGPDGRFYEVTAAVQLREAPNLSARSITVVPAGALVGVQCKATGDPVSGPYGVDSYWDKVVVDDAQGYLADEYVDTKTDESDDSLIPPC